MRVYSVVALVHHAHDHRDELSIRARQPLRRVLDQRTGVARPDEARAIFEKDDADMARPGLGGGAQAGQRQRRGARRSLAMRR